MPSDAPLGKLLTPLTEIEKAELLDAVPRDLPQHMSLRRVLSEIDAQRRRVAELEAENDHLKLGHDQLVSANRDAGAEVARLRAERDTLRKA